MIIDVILILAGLAGMVFMGWPSLVRLIILLTPGAIRCDFVAGPEAVTDVRQPAPVRDLVREFMALGFRPLGMKREWWPLRQGSRSLELVSLEARSFAAVYRLGESPLIYLYTPFHDGSVVLTADHENANFVMEGFIHGGINLGSPAELLALHQQNIARLQEEGRVPFADFDQRARLDATRAYYAHRGTRRILAGMMGRDLLVLAFPLGFLMYGALDLVSRLR